MAASDKILQALPLARRVQNVTRLSFQVIQRNGYFVSIDEKEILEFDTLQEANTAKDALNSALSQVRANILKAYEDKIQAILDA